MDSSTTSAGIASNCAVTRWAHLVDPANMGAFGMALVIEAQSEPLGLDIEVFTDYQKAIGWLTASSS